MGLSHSPLSHGRTQTDRQTPGCPRTLVFSPPHHKGFPRWKLPIPRPSCKAGGWGRGCRGTESDEGLRLACMSGFSPQEDLFPPLHLPSSKPYFTFFLLWNPPPDPPPRPPTNTFLSNLLWHSGFGHLPISGSVSRYREGGTPSSSHQNSASEDHLEPTVLSTQAHCQCSGKCRTKSAGWQVWGCVLTFLYCGPCRHCLLPQLLTALRPHPSSSLVACFSPCQRGKGDFLLGLGTVANPAQGPRGWACSGDFQRHTPVERFF